MRIDRTINSAGAVIALAVIVTVTALSVHAGWTPADLPGTLVWLDASDTGTLWADTNGTVVATNKVARWDDKSGNGNHQLQANTSYQPVSGTRMINGLNTVDFDGVNDTMQEAVNAFGSVISNTVVFMVTRYDNNAANILSLDAGFTYQSRYGDRLACSVNGSISWNGWIEFYYPDTTNLVNRVSMQELYYSVSENVFKPWIDGDDVLFKGSTDLQRRANGTVATTQGIRFPGGLDGAFCEVVIVDGLVTTEERQKMEGYLAWKWGMAGRLPDNHPYRWYEAGRPPAGTQLFGR